MYAVSLVKLGKVEAMQNGCNTLMHPFSRQFPKSELFLKFHYRLRKRSYIEDQTRKLHLLFSLKPGFGFPSDRTTSL